MHLRGHIPTQKTYRKRVGSQRGYMLLILMFFVALITFSMMAVLPKVIQQVKRDKEEEMIHRGTEYERAVKKFYKKFGRYPNSLKDMENTNNIRFIRRLYKDPMSKDGNWKLLHITDVQQGISNPNFGVSQANNFNPTQGGAAGQILGGTTGGLQAGGPQPGAPGSSPQDQSGSAPPTDQSQGGNTFSSGTGITPAGTGPQSTGLLSSAGQAGQPGGGGGGIVGVASVSKSKSIREFAGKSNYYKWMFIYDPTQDRGTLLKGPYNPQAFQGGGTNGTNGPNGTPGQAGTGTNNPGGFGPNSGPQQNGPGATLPPDQNAPPQ
jgi:type II secretory pathway pseudopilin PulG